MQKYYVSNFDKEIDLNSLEFIDMHIFKHRKLKNMTVNLNAKYSVSYNKKGNIFEIKKNSNFTDILSDYKINLKVICGKNGTGKTSILNLLNEVHFEDPKYVIIAKDKSNNFVSTQEINISFYNKTYILNIESKKHYFPK